MVPLFCIFFFFLKKVKGNRNDSADSTVTVMSSHRMSGVDRFWGPRRLTERRGWGLSPWKHPPWMITSRVGALTRDEQKKKKKIDGRVQSLTLSYFFFLLFIYFFLNAVFESFVVVVFFVTILISKLEVQSHRKEMFMSRLSRCHQRPKKRRKKGIAYLHQEVWGDFFLAVLTVFIYECLTAQFSRDL